MKYYVAPTSRTWLEIDCAALAHNIDCIMKTTGKKVIATVKADAYGLGAIKVAKLLARHGCYGFALACLDEAIELREAGIANPLMVLGYTGVENASLMARFDVAQTLVGYDYAKALNDEAKRLGVKIKGHLQLDTGLSRLGLFTQGDIYYKDAVDQAVEICSFDNLDIVGIYTHFAAADDPSADDYTAWQLENYRKVSDEIIARTGKNLLRHVSNSAATMYHPETYRDFDAVRPGVMLYGTSPRNIPYTPEEKFGLELQSAFSLRSRVGLVKEVPAGTKVSYGMTYTTDKETTIVTLPLGFADGYFRSFMQKGLYAVINGVRCPQIGKPCMDNTMFDASGANAKTGDLAILGGYGGLSWNEIGQMTGINIMTIPSLATRRVPRVYINEDASL